MHSGTLGTGTIIQLGLSQQRSHCGWQGAGRDPLPDRDKPAERKI